MASTATDDTYACEEIRLEWHEIAKAEVVRHRRRLGVLTPEQESQVESVLVSVADHMLEHVMDRARNFSGLDRLRYLSVWRRVRAAA